MFIAFGLSLPTYRNSVVSAEVPQNCLDSSDSSAHGGCIILPRLSGVCHDLIFALPPRTRDCQRPGIYSRVAVDVRGHSWDVFWCRPSSARPVMRDSMTRVEVVGSVITRGEIFGNGQKSPSFGNPKASGPCPFFQRIDSCGRNRARWAREPAGGWEQQYG